MKITIVGDYLEFEVNEGWKSNGFRIKIPPKDEYELDRANATFEFSKGIKTATISNLTSTQLNKILLEFFSYYSGYYRDYDDGVHTITIDEEDGFYIIITVGRDSAKEIAVINQ